MKYILPVSVILLFCTCLQPVKLNIRSGGSIILDSSCRYNTKVIGSDSPYILQSCVYMLDDTIQALLASDSFVLNGKIVNNNTIDSDGARELKFQQKGDTVFISLIFLALENNYVHCELLTEDLKLFLIDSIVNIKDRLGDKPRFYNGVYTILIPDSSKTYDFFWKENR